MGFLKKYKSKYWKLFFAAIVFLTLEAICDLLQPTIMSKIVDIGVANKNMNYVIHMGGYMLLVTGIGAIAAVSRNILSSNVSQSFGSEVRSDLFKKIQTFSFNNINKFEEGSLITRLTNDVTQVQVFVNGMMRIFVKAPILCIGSIIMATRLNPQLAVILLIIVPVIGILIYINMHLGYPYFIKIQKSLDRVNSVMREYLAGVRVVKAFNRFDYEVNRFEEANDELASISIIAMCLMTIFSPAIILTVNFGIVAVLWLGGIRVSKGNMHVGQIIAFINYMTQILFSLNMISFIFTMFVRARASAERIGEVFAQDNNINFVEEELSEVVIKGRIDFEKVYFSYSGNLDESVIKNITFTCMPGETIGIIGSTGSGKSSLINLIPRFYDAVAGSVKIDGIDVRKINPKKLRDIIAIVPQKTVLFTGTIIDNLRWGKKDASIEEIKEAASVAQVNDFISSLEEGYETRIGQGGVNFSGGQKQRISLARALVKKPKILILDDCTSAVDMVTEMNIREALKRYLDNLTCIIIGQRITSVMEADKIIVLDNGEIVGLGKHDELLKSCGVYKDIFRSQIGKEGVLSVTE